MFRHCPAMPSRSSASLIDVVSRRDARARDESSVTWRSIIAAATERPASGGSPGVPDAHACALGWEIRTHPTGGPLRRRILLTCLDDAAHQAEAEDDERTGNDPDLTDPRPVGSIGKP